MNIRTSSDEKIVTAFITGDIDHHSAKNIRNELDEYINQKKPLLLNLDFSGIKFMDSSGIGLIMGRYKLICSLGGRIKVINIPNNSMLALQHSYHLVVLLFYYFDSILVLNQN